MKMCVQVQNFALAKSIRWRMITIEHFQLRRERPVLNTELRVRYIWIFFITMKSSFEGENLYYRLFLEAFLKYSSCIACQLFLINMGL